MRADAQVGRDTGFPAPRCGTVCRGAILLQLEGEEVQEFLHTDIEDFEQEYTCRALLAFDGSWEVSVFRSDTCPGDVEPRTTAILAYGAPSEVSVPGRYVLPESAGGRVGLNLYDGERKRIRDFGSRVGTTLELEIDDIRAQVGGRVIGRLRAEVGDFGSAGGPYNAVVMAEFDLRFTRF